MKTTKKAVEKIISDYIAEEMLNIEEHDRIAEILKAQKGKPYNRRTFSDKVMGDGLKYVPHISLVYIEGRTRHLIGYDSTPEVDPLKFEQWDACNGRAARERIEKLKNLDIEKVTKLFSQIEKHWEGLRKMFGDVERESLGSYDNPVYYELLRNIDDRKESDRENQLYKMYYIRK